MQYAASFYYFGRCYYYTAINFYCYLNVWIALMHTTLIGFDCFDMGATTNIFYCYFNVCFALMCSTLLVLIALVGATATLLLIATAI